MKLFFIRKFDYFKIFWKSEILKTKISKHQIEICNFLNNFNFNNTKTINQKTLLLLLTVVKILMGHEIYVTDFIVEFKKHGGR